MDTGTHEEPAGKVMAKIPNSCEEKKNKVVIG